jgi:hypothetical protein
MRYGNYFVCFPPILVVWHAIRHHLSDESITGCCGAVSLFLVMCGRVGNETECGHYAVLRKKKNYQRSANRRISAMSNWTTFVSESV